MAEKITYMDCWHYIAPLIPVTDDPMTHDLYVMTFRALKEADEKEKAERGKLEKWLT